MKYDIAYCCTFKVIPFKCVRAKIVLLSRSGTYQKKTAEITGASHRTIQFTFWCFQDSQALSQEWKSLYCAIFCNCQICQPADQTENEEKIEKTAKESSMSHGSVRNITKCYLSFHSITSINQSLQSIQSLQSPFSQKMHAFNGLLKPNHPQKCHTFLRHFSQERHRAVLFTDEKRFTTERVPATKMTMLVLLRPSEFFLLIKIDCVVF